MNPNEPKPDENPFDPPQVDEDRETAPLTEEIKYFGVVRGEDVAHVMQVTNQLSTKSILWGMLILVVMVTLFFGAVAVYEETPLEITLTWIIAFSLPFLVLASLVLLQQRRLAKRRVDVDVEVSGSVSEEHLVITTKDANTTLRWSAVKRYRHLPSPHEMLLLFQSDTLVTPFPRHLFQSDSDWEQFVRLVQRKVKVADQER